MKTDEITETEGRTDIMSRIRVGRWLAVALAVAFAFSGCAGEYYEGSPFGSGSDSGSGEQPPESDNIKYPKMFSGSAASEDNSAIDLIRESKRDGDIEVTLVMKKETEPVTLTNDRDLSEWGLILNSGNSPEFVTINGQGRVIDLTGSNTRASPVITVQGGVTLTLRNITFKGIEAGVDGIGNPAPVIRVNGGRIILDSGAVIGENIDGTGNGGGANVLSGKLVMNAGSKISGNSTGFDGGGVFVDRGGSFVMYEGTIEKNAAFNNGGGGGVYVASGGSFLMYDGTVSDNTGGTGVSVNGSFIMNNGTVSGNTDGGVSVVDGLFTMNGGTVSGNNIAGNGVGVSVTWGTFTMNGGTVSGNTDGGVNLNGGTFTMNGGTVSGNEAGKGGGVNLNNAQFVLNGGTVSGNKATYSDGGGVYVSGGQLIMVAGAIKGNIATDSGGGVRLDGGSFMLYSGDVSENKAEKNGGGVFVSQRGTFNMDFGQIKGNKVLNLDGNGGGVYVDVIGTFNMNGGSIIGNGINPAPRDEYPYVPHSKGFGAGVYVDGGGRFVKTAGAINGLFSFDFSDWEEKGYQNYYGWEPDREGTTLPYVPRNQDATGVPGANSPGAPGIGKGYAVYYDKDGGYWRDQTVRDTMPLSTDDADPNPEAHGWNIVPQ